MSIAQTTRLAYQILIETNGISPARRAVVLALEEMQQPLTRWEIQKYLEMSGYGYQINSITPRVNELVSMGILTEDGSTKSCTVTHNTAKVVRLAK